MADELQTHQPSIEALAADELWQVQLVDHSPELATTIKLLAEQVSQHDHVSPLNEQALRILAGQLPGQHLVAVHDSPSGAQQVLGYAQVDTSDNSVQLFVLPQARRHGIGRALGELAARQVDSPDFWSFGTLPAARQLGATMGLQPVRGLLKMALDPSQVEVASPGPPPEGITVTTFTPADIDDFVELNALAFAHHPEQGRMSRQDVEDKVDEDWFDAQGLFFARDDQGRMLGFHWTKVVTEDNDAGSRLIGEVYVIGVHPFEHGRGLGRHLLAVGLAHLLARGSQLIELYVEADQTRVVQMYENAGFTEALRDTRWS
ncbi:mycothiol synthase [Propionibacteriaceae bacterium G1746]|uniref:mycothiol synthase n=1 Tax=Aestuariimicrobium sp. G57 TaxID=3418485 RepID=UPI003C1A7298